MKDAINNHLSEVEGFEIKTPADLDEFKKKYISVGGTVDQLYDNLDSAKGKQMENVGLIGKLSWAIEKKITQAKENLNL